MAELGFRTFNEMIGRTDLLMARKAVAHWKAKGLDFSRLFHRPKAGKGVAVYNCEAQNHGLDKALDHELIRKARPALESKTPVEIDLAVRNVNRTVGAMLSGEVARRHGHAGLPDDTIRIRAKGTGGQSFGAWLARGVTIELEGDANDYVGKGLSGGRIAIYPAKGVRFRPEENIVVGNTVLYGAIAGECYFRGVAGERFAVRNSGAIAVVEGVGDHGCEYMTGGCVVVLGRTGRNFAAGMSGGIAYVLDETGDFERHCNTEMVELERIRAAPLAGTEDWTALPLAEVMGDVLGDDVRRLRVLIERHRRFTGSAVAGRILDRWDELLPKFVKVVSADYRRALIAMRAEAEAAAKTAAAE
jgi:glutamate synthase (NADPH/NADH) large chain